MAGAAFIAPVAQAQTQSGSDRIAVNLDDPARPAFVKASLVNGSITVKAYDGKEVIVEARGRNQESEKPSGGPKRLNISTTGFVEEENNEIRIGTESYARGPYLSVPDHLAKAAGSERWNIVVTGVDGDLDVDDINGAVT